VIPAACGELLAERIEGARLVTIPGIDHVFWIGPNRALADRVIDEVERFVTGGVGSAATDRVLTTVLFTDIVSSTTRAAELGDRAWREVLEAHDAIVQQIVTEHGGRVVKHIGDGALSAFDGPARAIRCAEALRDAVAAIDLELRAGVHTGECEVIGEDLAGLAVHIGARIGAFAGPGEVAASSTVKELVVGSDIAFEDRGTHELKGVPEAWRIFVVGEQRGERTALDGADAHMRRSDRVAVTFARRLPRVSRLGARLASGGLRSA
jgi:class 3 adenylate cyclase